jgi:hypothetical protein
MENSINDDMEKNNDLLDEILAFIEDWAETNGDDDAVLYAISKYGKENVDKAVQYQCDIEYRYAKSLMDSCDNSLCADNSLPF